MAPIASILAFLGFLVLLGILIARLRHKPPQRPPRNQGPERFAREPLALGRERSVPRRLGVRRIALPLLAALLLGWVGLSVLASLKADPDADAALAPEAAPGPDPEPPASVIARKLDPPPPLIVNPEIPPEILEDPSADFAPEPEPPTSPMAQGAFAIAPVISRMEPLGRSLNPATPAPPPDPATLGRAPAPPPPPPRLVAPPPAPLAPPPAPPREPQTGPNVYTVVVGSFTTETNANAFRDKLLAAGLPAEIIPFHKQNQTWYRVRSGRFAEKAEAEDYIRDLKRKNLVDSTYVLDLGRS